MTRGCLNIALSETYRRNVSVCLMAILVRLAHRQVSLPLRRYRIYLSRGLICGKLARIQAAFCRLFLAHRKYRKVDQVTLKENERNVALMNGQTTHGGRNTRIVLTLLIMVVREIGAVAAMMAEAFSLIFVKEKREHRYIHHRSCLTNLHRIPSSLPDWFPSRSVSPISATCSPGNSRFTRRIRAELAVHASANCY